MTLGIGVDTGGTHTDVVLVDPATAVFLTLKVATTPGDLGDGIVEGIARALVEAGRDPGEVGRLVYGTTVVTNLIVEGREGGVGLITTKGFRDVLAIARASRKENVYDIHWRPPRPLVSRRLRRGVPERVDHQGRVHLPLDEDATRDAIRSLAAAGVESLAICLLNAYANPVHEERIAEIAEEEAPNLTLSLSSRVVREFREYERTSTTAMNAFVARPLARHLRDLERRLADRGLTVPPAIMRSNGGLMTFRGAQSLPVALTHSGPMGGIVGGAAIAEACGIANAITLDMGGTSADVALIRDGRPLATTRGKLGAHAVLLPMLDLVTIGAGGGSVAWLDAGGSLKVGPRSAGAEPGPACYGQGGTEPTVTDANLVCGRLNDSYFLAGARRLRADLAEMAVEDSVAGPLGLDPVAASSGILAIANSHMVNAIKLLSVQRGLDPRDFTLVAFGGCGPLHGAALADELGMDRVLVPAAPGNVSAMGLLAADVRYDVVRTRVAALDSLDPADLAAEFAALIEEGVAALARETVAEEDRRLVPAVDLRYRGQNYELTLPLPAEAAARPDIAALRERFHGEHRRAYGYDLPNRAIQLVNLRLSAIGVAAAFAWPRRPGTTHGAPVGERKVRLRDGATAAIPVYRHDDTAEGQRGPGPAMVEYPGATLFVPGAWEATFDAWRHAHLNRKDGDR